MKIKSFFTNNELYLRIILNSILGILLAVFLSLFAYVLLTEKNFIDNYNASKDIILDNINSEYSRLNNEIVAVLDASAENKYLHDYLIGEKSTTANMHNIVYHMNELLRDNHLLYKNIKSNLVVVGLEDSVFFVNSSNRVINYNEIMESSAVTSALSNPEYINYEFNKKGIDSLSKNESFITVSKVLKNKQDGSYYGVSIISLSQSDFSSVYRTLIDEKINSIYIIDNHTDTIISSNHINKISSSYSDLDRKNNYERKIHLSFPNFVLISHVNRNDLINQMYSFPILILILLFVISLVSIIVMKILKSVTEPIYDLTENMKYVKEGSFDHKVDERGTNELITLISTYNYMLDDLNSYVNKLVDLENKKRQAELHALQLQINPHFIYNTLNTIKMLIITNEHESAILGIDAFIRLLRNTVASVDSEYTLKEEVLYLKDYSYIQKLRYGKNIIIQYDIPKEFENINIPKLIIQPFIENSFFHGFTTRESGFINVIVYRYFDDVKIEIIDDGIGMKQGDMFHSKHKKNHQTNKMTKLGTQNVDDRIKLLYGDAYGVEVFSELNKGTIVTIKLPII